MRCEIIDGKAESAAYLLGALLQWLKLRNNLPKKKNPGLRRLNLRSSVAPGWRNEVHDEGDQAT